MNLLNPRIENEDKWMTAILAWLIEKGHVSEAGLMGARMEAEKIQQKWKDYEP